MKKLTLTTLALVLIMALMLTACGQSTSAASGSASAAEKDYAAIIEAARDDEMNEVYPIISGKYGEEPTLSTNPNNISDDEAKAMMEMMLDFYTMDSNTLCEQYALSVSLMNVRSYAVGIFMPAEGQHDAVLEKANEFKQSQMRMQEYYLIDQYEIAKNAVVKELSSGEIILVMCDGADKVAESIENALK